MAAVRRVIPYAPPRSDGAPPDDTARAIAPIHVGSALAFTALYGLVAGAVVEVQFAAVVRQFGMQQLVPRMLGLAAVRAQGSTAAAMGVGLATAFTIARASKRGGVRVDRRRLGLLAACCLGAWPVATMSFLAGGLAAWLATGEGRLGDFWPLAFVSFPEDVIVSFVLSCGGAALLVFAVIVGERGLVRASWTTRVKMVAAFVALKVGLYVATTPLMAVLAALGLAGR